MTKSPVYTGVLTILHNNVNDISLFEKNKQTK